MLFDRVPSPFALSLEAVPHSFPLAAAAASALVLYFYLARDTAPRGIQKIISLSQLEVLDLLFGKADYHTRTKRVREIMEENGIMRMKLGSFHLVQVARPEFVKAVLTGQDIDKVSLNEEQPGSFTVKAFGENIIFSKRNQWRKYRRIMNPAFATVPIQIYDEQGARLASHIKRSKSRLLEVGRLIKRIALDIIGLSAFGYNFNALDEPHGHYVTIWSRIIERSSKFVFLLLPWLEKFFDEFELLEEMEGMIADVIQKKRELLRRGNGDETGPSSLLTRMIKANELEGEISLSNAELKNNVMAFMLAGSDTVANTLTCCLYYLAKHKQVQTRAREEVLRVVGADEEITLEKQKSLLYLTKVIKETLRLCPPTPSLTLRCLASPQTIGEYTIPPGVNITVDIYSIHHSPTYWPDPERFDPERFTEEKEKLRPAYTWLPFGGGPRICLGSRFALVEISVLLAHLLRFFEVEVPARTLHKERPYLHEMSWGVIGPKNMELIFKELR
ncbi:uncharacterized protein VTP21DRAFT_2808 [Calcarisporiella thermophila]|uniref:uncharacterized protein n=1 Tax=Calcarisporiella thermophila TaxID=911321 RepID=UPI003742B847